MEVKGIFLCDSVSTHPDGTFSLLRGGIDNCSVPAFPANIRLGFVVILELMSTEVDRPHVAELDMIDEDGNRILPQHHIPFNNPMIANVPKYKTNLVGEINLLIQKPGKYSLHVAVDGHHLSSAGFQVMLAARSPESH